MSVVMKCALMDDETGRNAYVQRGEKFISPAGEVRTLEYIFYDEDKDNQNHLVLARDDGSRINVHQHIFLNEYVRAANA